MQKKVPMGKNHRHVKVMWSMENTAGKYQHRSL